MSFVMRRGRAAFVVFALLAAGFVQARDRAGAANAFPTIEQSLALIGSVADNGNLDSQGTAFCVSSDGTRSYFITNNHVVTDDDGQPLDNLVIILAKDMHEAHAPRYHATIVRRSLDPDLAIVAIDVPSLAPLHISTKIPAVGDDIAIAGFPYEEAIVWGRLFGGRALRLDRPFPPELTPSEHKGSVSAIHGGSYYIQYDALTDSGNSGGPLFDPSSGEVFGVVQASVPGAPDDRDLPSPVRNNLAISIAEGWNFIARAPVNVSSSVAAGSGEHFAARNRACALAQGRFERAYGVWSHARSAAAALQSDLNNPRYAPKRTLLLRGLRGYASAQDVAQRQMQGALRAVSHRSPNTASLDRALLAAITARNASDQTIAQAAHKLNARSACTE